MYMYNVDRVLPTARMMRMIMQNVGEKIAIFMQVLMLNK